MSNFSILVLVLILLINFIVNSVSPSAINRTSEDIYHFKYEGRFWQDEIIYQIYPRSFYDCDGDGVGDLAGIKSKVDYLVDLGVGIVWISPIYESPMKDFGYDISDYKNIDPIFGTLDDFNELIKEYHSKGLKIVMDYVPNHTSDKHEWFQKSIEKDPDYEDFYVWMDSRGKNESGHNIPPNNWLSSFRFSAWEWNEKRQQFYYHKYLKEQPDLNYRNPKVEEAMKDVLRFWLDRGVDGFRLDAVSGLVETSDMMSNDEPVAENSNVTNKMDYDYLNHTLTENLPETYDIIRSWKEILDQYGDKVLMSEAYNKNIDVVMNYYGELSNPVTDFPFNFFFIDKLKSRDDVTGTNLKSIINLWLENMPENRWPNWVLGNHDNNRVGSRLGVELIDALNMLTLLLPGTPVTYYGEEFGMVDANISYEEAKDPKACNYGPKRYSAFGRDPERTPMQWDDSMFAGFTEGNATWLPVNDDYKSLNVEAQRIAPQSHMKLYSDLAALRQKSVFRKGKIAFLANSKDVLAFARCLGSGPNYFVVINVAKEDKTIDLRNNNISVTLPEMATVILKSSMDDRKTTEPGSRLNLSRLSLQAGEGMVLLMIGSL